MTTTSADFDARFLSGNELYGDDFTQAEIDDWFADEREGYANLSDPEDRGKGAGYGYANFNDHLTFRHLPAGRLGDALGLGAADGAEFATIAHRLDSITILEPSQQLRRPAVAGVPLAYVDPDPSGRLPAADATYDLVTSFGVLHHIPNVSLVVAEVARVLRPGGYFVVREPIHSMGDWRAPRAGLTRRERGIPRHLLDRMMTAHFEVVHATACDFPLRGRMPNPDSPANVWVDQVLARAFAWNYRYHARSRWEKIRPRGMAYVLRKPSQDSMFARP